MLDGARLVLAVSGGIAAYKAADLCSRLVQAGTLVDVVLTPGALAFVQPPLFNALTHRPVLTDLATTWSEGWAGHVTLAHDADLLVVAPATANTLARLALGLADDLLGAVALATRAPLLLAPAMEHNMWHHPATQTNIATLRSRGATVVGPASGRLASGAAGDGRLAPADDIFDSARQLLGRDGPLAGVRVVVTAGPTHEPLDPVRFFGNRSSGRMGIAVVRALVDRGASVHLVAGPISTPIPAGIESTTVETALEMLQATERAVADAELLIMAAAVADFRPAHRASEKIKKEPGRDTLDLRLERNPDILAAIDHPGLIKVGFAAETENLLANAQAKLESKGLALIVANDAVATIGSGRSTATFIGRDRPPHHLPDLDKDDLAALLADECVSLIKQRRGEDKS